MTATTFTQVMTKAPRRARAGGVSYSAFKAGPGLERALRAYLDGMVQLAGTGHPTQRLREAVRYLRACGASGPLGDLLEAATSLAGTAEGLDRVGKYRPDQSRDERGRFSDEGKGRARGGVGTVKVPLDASLPAKLGDVSQALAEAKQGAPIASVASKLKDAAKSFGQEVRDTLLVPGIMETIAGAAIVVGLLAYFYFGGSVPPPKDLPDVLNPGLDLLRWLWRNLPQIP